MSSLLRLFISPSNFTKISQNYAQILIASNQFRSISLSAIRQCIDKDENELKPPIVETNSAGLSIDRTKIIPVETSISYLTSAAYKETYGNKAVWIPYRRNHKGQLAPKKTRKTCIRKGLISTGNPCPICRDEYLVLDYRNLDLLKQFISPQTGEVLSYSTTGVCQRKHQQLLIAVDRAMDYGLLTFDVPFREYNYEQYYDKSLLKQHQ